MINIVFSQYHGVTMGDGYVEEDCAKFLQDALEDNDRGLDSRLITSSSLVVTWFRVALKENRVNTSDIKFLFLEDGIETQVQHDQDGRFGSWPTGFCDHYGKLLARLL